MLHRRLLPGLLLLSMALGLWDCSSPYRLFSRRLDTTTSTHLLVLQTPQHCPPSLAGILHTLLLQEGIPNTFAVHILDASPSNADSLQLFYQAGFDGVLSTACSQDTTALFTLRHIPSGKIIWKATLQLRDRHNETIETAIAALLERMLDERAVVPREE